MTFFSLLLGVQSAHDVSQVTKHPVYIRAKYSAFHSLPLYSFSFFFLRRLILPDGGPFWEPLEETAPSYRSFLPYVGAREPRHLPRELQPRIKISSRSCVAGILGWYVLFRFSGKRNGHCRCGQKNSRRLSRTAWW